MTGPISDKPFTYYPGTGYLIHPSIAELEANLVREVPPGFYCVCHICNPPKPLTKEEDKDHDRKVHNIRR